MDPVLANIGANVRKYRKTKKLTIEKLAKAAELSAKYVQGFEVGKRNMSITNLSRIATALNVDLEALVRIESKFYESKEDKIFGISERLKSFDNRQLNLIDSMIGHIDIITNAPEEEERRLIKKIDRAEQ